MPDLPNQPVVYSFIRMWAPPFEEEKVYYVTRLPRENQVDWSVSRDYDEANLFRHTTTAVRVLRGNHRILDRINRGWLYQIISVIEEVVDSNEAEIDAKEEAEKETA